MTVTDQPTTPPEALTLPDWIDPTVPHRLGSSADTKEAHFALVPVFEALGWAVEWRQQFGKWSYRVTPPGWTDADEADLIRRQNAYMATQTSRFD